MKDQGQRVILRLTLDQARKFLVFIRAEDELKIARFIRSLGEGDTLTIDLTSLESVEGTIKIPELRMY